MNNFREYTMISPRQLAPYFGFSDDEVQMMCKNDQLLDIDENRRWYDGYLLENVSVPPERKRTVLHMCNPNSLVNAFMDQGCESYWKNTGSFKQLNDYIELDMDGLKTDALEMLAGGEVPVDVSSFQNDLTSFSSTDDVLTALIHMGYIGYDPQTGKGFIQNEEVREVFSSAVKVGGWKEIAEAIRKSDELLKVRKSPSGKGFADIAFIPKPGSGKPAMIVKLKWNDDADTAIKQTKDQRYAGRLYGFVSDILLVGISYDKKEKKYECRIEKAE